MLDWHSQMAAKEYRFPMPSLWSIPVVDTTTGVNMKKKGEELVVGDNLAGIGVIFMIREVSSMRQLYIRGTLPMFVSRVQVLEVI